MISHTRARHLAWIMRYNGRACIVGGMFAALAIAVAVGVDMIIPLDRAVITALIGAMFVCMALGIGFTIEAATLKREAEGRGKTS